MVAQQNYAHDIETLTLLSRFQDLESHLTEFAEDVDGSTLVQKLLRTSGIQDQVKAFEEILPDGLRLSETQPGSQVSPCHKSRCPAGG